MLHIASCVYQILHDFFQSSQKGKRKRRKTDQGSQKVSESKFCFSVSYYESPQWDKACMNTQHLVTGSTLVTFGSSHIQMEGLAPNYRQGRNVLSGSHDWEHKVFHLSPSPAESQQQLIFIKAGLCARHFTYTMSLNPYSHTHKVGKGSQTCATTWIVFTSATCRKSLRTLEWAWRLHCFISNFRCNSSSG